MRVKAIRHDIVIMLSCKSFMRSSILTSVRKLLRWSLFRCCTGLPLMKGELDGGVLGHYWVLASDWDWNIGLGRLVKLGTKWPSSSQRINEERLFYYTTKQYTYNILKMNSIGVDIDKFVGFFFGFFLLRLMWASLSLPSLFSSELLLSADFLFIFPLWVFRLRFSPSFLQLYSTNDSFDCTLSETKLAFMRNGTSNA